MAKSSVHGGSTHTSAWVSVAATIVTGAADRRHRYYTVRSIGSVGGVLAPLQYSLHTCGSTAGEASPSRVQTTFS